MDISALLTDWMILGIVALIVVVTVLLVWRIRSEHNLTEAPPPKVVREIAEGPASHPRFEDLVPEEFTKGSFSSQLQTDSYNLRIESVRDMIRYVVNGISYNTIEDIPNNDMRRVAQKLYEKTFKTSDWRRADTELLRQVQIGNQATIESKSPSANISVQKQDRSTRYIVNGLTYYALNEIPDPELRDRAKDLLGKMML